MTKRRELDEFSRRIAEILPYMLREFARRERNDLTRGRISFPQLIALEAAARHGRVKMTDLARVLAIKMSSATVLVDRLIRQKMLVRERDARDRRLVWARITPRGENVIRTFRREKQKSMRGIFGVLTAAERREYLRMMTKVRDRLVKQ